MEIDTRSVLESDFCVLELDSETGDSEQTDRQALEKLRENGSTMLQKLTEGVKQLQAAKGSKPSEQKITGSKPFDRES